MLDSNYTAFEGNIIGAVTRMAFGSPISQLMTRVLYFMMCWMLFIVIYIYLVSTFQKFACLPAFDRYLYCFISYEL